MIPLTAMRVKSPSKLLRAVGLLSLLVGFFFLFSTLYADLIVPLGISIFFAYLMIPVVDSLQSILLFDRRKIALTIILAVFSLVIFIVLMVLPVFIREAVALKIIGLQFVDLISKDWFPRLYQWILSSHLLSIPTLNRIIQSLNPSAQLSQSAGTLVSYLFNSMPSFFFGMLSFALLPILSYFWVSHYPSIRKLAKDLVPVDFVPPVKELMNRLDVSIRAFITGQMFVASANGLLYIFGLWMVDVEYSFAIGLASGFARMIPYADAVVCLLLGTLVLVSHNAGGMSYVWMLLVVVLVQLMDASIITPKIMGGRVGLHPVLVIITVIAMGNSFGFFGVLLALPTLAVAKVLFDFSLVRYKRSRLYLG